MSRPTTAVPAIRPPCTWPGSWMRRTASTAIPITDRAKDQGIEERDQDADPLVAKGLARVRRAAGLAKGEAREPKHNDVGQDVAGIAEEGEAVRQ